MSSIDFLGTIETATKAAHAAGLTLQSYAHKRSDLIISAKSQNDLVSQADRDAELTILDIIKSETPQFGIVAEETGGQTFGPATWYIDPLDGTTNFLHGIPCYAVSIGLVAHAGTKLHANQPELEHDTPIVSVIYDPNRNEMFTSVYQTGAWLNSNRITCSHTSKLAESVLATGFPYRDFSFEDKYHAMFRDATRQTRGVRRFGSAALDLAWVACGRFDGFWELGLAPWDVAAGTLLIRESGGTVECLYQQDPWPMKGNIIASNKLVFSQLHNMLERHL